MYSSGWVPHGGGAAAAAWFHEGIVVFNDGTDVGVGNLLSTHEPVKGVGITCAGTGAFQSVGGMTAPPRTGGPPPTATLLVGGIWR